MIPMDPHGEGCALAPALCDHSEREVLEYNFYKAAFLNPKEELEARAAVRATSPLRTFATGATRDTEEGKLDYEGFLSPIALERFAQYMDGHRYQKDGSVRASDNWQMGMPLDVYMKSLLRHVIELWTIHRGHRGVPTGSADTFARDKSLEDALCAIQFNVQGYLHATILASTE